MPNCIIPPKNLIKGQPTHPGQIIGVENVHELMMIELHAEGSLRPTMHLVTKGPYLNQGDWYIELQGELRPVFLPLCELGVIAYDQENDLWQNMVWITEVDSTATT